jgi:hypothetical protein
MAAEEPEVGFDIEFGCDLALFEASADIGDIGDTIEHQHRRHRKLGVARPEEFTLRAFDKIIV